MKLNKYPKYDGNLLDRAMEKKTKSLDHKIKVKVTYKQYEVNDNVRLNKYVKPSNSIGSEISHRITGP